MKHTQCPKARPRSPHSAALLPSLPSTLTLQVQHSTGPFRSVKRTLQLRGPVVVLSKSAESTSDYDALIPLCTGSQPRRSGSTSATLNGHRLRFSSAALLNNFLTAAAEALTQSTEGAARYSVLREIGHGASGVVYLVRRKQDGQMLAMKAISKVDTFANDTHLANIISERTALVEAAQRGTPFIVKLVDAFETRHHLCFVTELGAFGDLHDVLKQMPGRRVSEQVAKNLFAEIVLALEETHRMGYLFRDLKLSNLLMTRGGHVRLADFGLAKKLDTVRVEGSAVSSDSGEESSEEDEQVKLVGRTNSFVGTRRYMSPEHLLGGVPSQRGYGAPSDVWALGVTLFLMLTGEYPFGRGISARDTKRMFFAIANEEIAYPKWLSVEVVELLNGLLKRDSLERFDIAEIKSHPWMKGIDWGRVRAEAALDTPREEVVGLLQQHGVSDVESSSEGKSLGDEGEFLSYLSGSGSDSERRRRQVVPSFQLLGFGYLNM